jgi:type VI protein secretion system component Hcp
MQIILLDYPGVKGEVTLSGYVGMVACTSLSVNMQKSEDSGDIGSLSMGDFVKAKPDGGKQRAGIDSLTLNRSVDKASPKFMKLAFAEKSSNQKASIMVFRAYERDDFLGIGGVSLSLSTDGASLDTNVIKWHEPFLKITLTDVHISSHEISVSESSLDETLRIMFREITMEYFVYRNGKPMGSVVGHVDLADQ